MQTSKDQQSIPSCWNCGFREKPRELMTIAEVSRFCQVSRAAVYRWMAEGCVDWIHTAGGRRRIYKDSLVRLPN